MNQLSTITCFKVETSHLVNVPRHFEVTSLSELRSLIQKIADGGRDFGDITYRYELDKDDQVEIIHAYFVNRAGNRARFMRLRKDPK